MSPFDGVTPFEVLGKVLKEPVEPVSRHATEIPPELAAVADKALSRDRAARYPSAKELADESEAFQQGQRVGAYSYGSWELVERFVAKNKALSLGALAALVTLAVASVLVLLAWGREQQARTAAERQRSAAEQQRKEATIVTAMPANNRVELRTMYASRSRASPVGRRPHASSSTRDPWAAARVPFEGTADAGARSGDRHRTHRIAEPRAHGSIRERDPHTPDTRPLPRGSPTPRPP